MLFHIPSNAVSSSSSDGVGLFLRRAYMDITMPGVQNPHCEPCAFAMRSYMVRTGCPDPNKQLNISCQTIT